MALSLALASQAPNAWAQFNSALVDAQDYSLIERFPGAQIVDYRTPGITTYSLALDRMQRVNGRVSAGREERVYGTLTRITYQIPEGYSGSDAFEHFSEQMLQVGPELFRCRGRGCGSSSFWANDMFENRILYGPEAEQYYLAAAVGSDEQQVNGYVALYVITRANRRVYAHLDIVELNDQVSDIPTTDPEALALQLRQEGSLIVQGVAFNEQDELVDEGGLTVVLNALRNDPLMQVYIVAHLAGDAPLENLLSRSAQRAQSLADSLIEAGINARRILAQGVGPLAPSCRQAPCAQRVEIVLRP